MRRPLLAAALAAAVATAVVPAAASPLEPPRDQWYAANEAQVGKGHWGPGTRMKVAEHCEGLVTEQERAACTLEDFRTRPFVVVAFVDSGINPYHHDFRAPEFQVHPSEYLTGYPAGAAELDLALDVADTEGYRAARAEDDAEWSKVRHGELRWFPGTRIVGGISVAAGGTGGTGLTGLPERKILDENGHGTGVVSVAAGQAYGANPNALIVMVEGLGMNGVSWATQQPWIDAISNSWGPGLPGRADVPTSMAFTKAAVEKGQSLLFSSGNGARNTNSSTVFTDPATDPCRCKVPPPNSSTTASGSGPSWHITVGAASPVNGQAYWWHGRVPDVVSFGAKWRAAAADGVTVEDGRDFGGTSCATPITAGVLSSLLLRARIHLDDATEGPDGAGIVAKAGPGAAAQPATGPLADGVLTRAELERALMTTAAPVQAEPQRLGWDYAVEPTTAAYFVAQGYGLVDRGSKARAEAVLLGAVDYPARADVDQWRAVTDAVRDVEWS